MLYSKPTSAPEENGSVVVCMATFPQRYGRIHEAVASLAPQVDRVYIYANETTDGLPAFDHLGNVTVLDSREFAGNLSANGKIFPIRFLRNCLVFTVDDDFVYPPDYVARYREVFDCFENRCCVTTHGSIFPAHVRWYYERSRTFAAQRALAAAQLVTLAGSGTFAFHQSTLHVDPEDYLSQIMVDLRLSLTAREQGLPIWCVPRPEKWLHHLGGEGLWEQYRATLTHHTHEARKHDWSFAHYREITYPLLDLYERKRAAEAISFRIDPELLHALKKDEMPSFWRNDWRIQMMRARYMDVLKGELDAAAG